MTFFAVNVVSVAGSWHNATHALQKKPRVLWNRGNQREREREREEINTMKQLQKSIGSEGIL